MVGKIVLQIIIQLHCVKARVLGQLQALPQIHALGIRESPEVYGFFHRLPLGRSAAGIRVAVRGASTLSTKTAAPPAAARAPLMAARRLYPGIESSGLFFMMDGGFG